MGAVVSTCSATSSPSPWLPWLLARLLCLCPLATSPDLSLDLLPLLPGGLHRLPTLVSLLTMWARGKLLSLSLLAIFPDSSLDLRLPALDILTARMRRPRSPTTYHSRTTN